MENIVREICQKEGIKARNIQVLSGGQVNAVFLVEGEVVIRIGSRGDALQRMKHESELIQSLGGEIPVPKIYALGQHGGLAYQVQQVLPGQKLYSAWKNFRAEEQENIVAELVGYLKIIHNRRCLSFGYAQNPSSMFESWSQFIADHFQKTLDEIAALGIRMVPGYLEMAMDYFEAHKHVLQNSVPVLVHGDLSLVNLLVDKGKISGILDFEYSLQAPKDYELWVTEAFCLYPNDWAEEENEVYCSADFANFFNLLQKYYPEMFEIPDLRQRVNIYQLEASLSNYLAWRKDNLSTIPPEVMAAKEFYMARITNFIFTHGTRMFFG